MGTHAVAYRTSQREQSPHRGGCADALVDLNELESSELRSGSTTTPSEASSSGTEATSSGTPTPRREFFAAAGNRGYALIDCDELEARELRAALAATTSSAPSAYGKEANPSATSTPLREPPAATGNGGYALIDFDDLEANEVLSAPAAIPSLAASASGKEANPSATPTPQREPAAATGSGGYALIDFDELEANELLSAHAATSFSAASASGKEVATAAETVAVTNHGKQVEKPPRQTVSVSARHATGKGEVRLEVSADFTMKGVKATLISKVGRGRMSTVRLAKKVGGSFVAYVDADRLGDVRTVWVLGLSLAGLEDGASPATGAPGDFALPVAPGSARSRRPRSPSAGSGDGGSGETRTAPRTSLGEAETVEAVSQNHSNDHASAVEPVALPTSAKDSALPHAGGQCALGPERVVITAEELALRRRRWLVAAGAFVEMLLQISAEETFGGRGWFQGLDTLISFPPRGNLPFVGGDDLAFDDFAAALLHDAHMARQLPPNLGPGGDKLGVLLGRLEDYVAEATKNAERAFDWTSFPGAFGELSRENAMKAMAQVEPPFGGFGPGRRFLLFVGLPIALYVSDCPHLYQLVRRFRSLANMTQAASAESVREALDVDGRPYSMLAFALMAALQALHRVRFASTPTSHGLEPLAPKGGALIFRGIWVPEVVDEHLASCSWSFNSFSRCTDGVVSVLNFYARAEGGEPAKLAQEHAHIFIVVMRLRTGGGEWAFPVQLFAGGEWAFPANVEQEVVLPPFVQYVWEEGMEVSSDQSLEERRRLAGEVLDGRWGLNFEKESPPILDLLSGAGATDRFRTLRRAPRITVRFARSVELAAPLRELFESAEVANSAAPGGARRRLLEFPKVAPRMQPQAADWRDAEASLSRNGKPFGAKHGWSTDTEPPMKLSVTGTWNDWAADDMRWHGGAFVYPVVVGSNGWESFQLLRNESWGEVYYPSEADASHWEKTWTVCGPDDQGHGQNWQIGKHRVEKINPGVRYCIVAGLDASGRVCTVSWRPL